MPTIFKKTAKLSPAILTVFTLFGLLFIFADSVKAAPSIDSITPNEVDSIDSPVDVTVSGSGFSTSSVKILDDSGREISSASTTVVDSTQINCEFDVSGYVGVWDVKVINGDNSSSTLADSLTINYVGRITSQIHDAGLDKYFSNISWTADTGANSSVTVYVRTATTSDMSTAPDWSTCDPVTSGNDISGNNCVTDGHRYVQYRAVLSSSAANDIPEIKDINISYYGNGTLESSYFNSTVSNNTLQDISWRQQLEGNSGVIMYLRTATTSAGLSGASWHEIASSTNFGYLTDGCSLSSVNSETDQVDCASSTIPAELRDGSGDQWLQYRAGLVTFDGISIPTVTWISPNYNAMIPVLATVTPASKVDNLDTSQITITGSGFVSGAMVKLENGSGLSVTASSTVASSTEIRADFDLSGYAGDFDLVVTNPNGSSGSKDYQIDNVGRFTSQIRDPGSDLNPTYVSGTIDWTATTSATTSVSLKLRSDSSSDMSGADAWSSCTPVSHNQDIFASNCVHDGDRYLQYRAVLRSSSSEEIPTLNNVTINLQSSGSLTSSQFDSSDSNNIMGGVEWTQQVPTGGITLYYRTASSSNGLSGASWHEIASSTSAGQVTSGCTLSGSGTTTVDCDNSVFPDALSDSVEDQWFQYKVEISTGSTSPRFLEINTDYVVNEPPQLHNVTATQTASGQIEISYQVRDVDTTLAKYTPGEVTPAFEYSLDGGSTWYTPTSSCFAAGDWDNKTVQEDAWSSYTATWDAECDPNLTDRYSTTTVIRLTMDDNELANNITSTTTAETVLDTVEPVLGNPPFSVGARMATTTNATLDFNITDDSDLFTKVSLNSDLSGASWVNYTATSTIDLDTRPDTVYAQFKDQYGNTTTIQSAVTPQKPVKVMIQDATNMEIDPPDIGLLVAWQKTGVPGPGFGYYNVYRSTSTDPATFEYIGHLPSVDINYYVDYSINSTTTDYYYRVTSEDSDGNESYYSDYVHGIANGTQDAGEGGGGSLGTPPEISNVEVPTSSIQTTQATVLWDTDKLSDSTVGYSTSPGNFDNEIGVGTMLDNAGNIGRHEVVLTSLQPSTTYYFMVESIDNSGNIATSTNGGDGYTFTTDPGPIISNVATSSITNTSATIDWTTDIPADSQIVYSENSNFTSTKSAHENESVTDHQLSLTGLSPGTIYYYQVEATDANGYTATDNNGGNYYTFTTTEDTQGPVITFSTSSDIKISGSSAKVTWTTDEPATSTLEYGTTTACNNSMSIDNFNTGHIYYLENLQSSTTYYLKLKSTDANGIPTTDDNGGSLYSFITGDTADHTAPTITSAPSASLIGDTFAVIKWETSETSDSQIHWGTTSGDYANTETNNTFDTTHSMTIDQLTPVTDYYFYVESGDPSGNATSSGEYSFTTLEELSEESEVQQEIQDSGSSFCGEGTEWNGSKCVSSGSSGGGGTVIIDKSDKSSPVVSELEVTDRGAQSAVVEWRTDEPADSFVEYGTEDSYGLTQGDKSNTTEHSVTLNYLSPNTTYYYRAVSEDDWGNVGMSEDNTLTTQTATEELKDEIADRESDFSFEDIEQMTQEEQQKTAQELFDMAMESTRKAMQLIQRTQTDMSLSDFETTLMMQEELLSDFAAQLPAPLLSGSPRVLTTAKTATVIWRTDKESNSLVAYASDEEYPIGEDEPYSQVVGDPEDVTTEHRVNIQNLEPETTYHYQLRSKAKLGPTAQSRDFTFTTEDETLEINNYTVDKRDDQTAIFKWTTNIQADTKVRYTPYRDGELSVEEREVKQDETVTTMHSMKMEELEAGVIYEVELISQDLNENTVRRKISAFSTTEDNYPPKITQIQTESALAPGQRDQVQTIISWRTNELATSKLYYKQGIAQPGDELTEETQLNDNYTKNHVVVLTDFEPGNTYSFKVESMDSSGNVSTSKINTVLAPQRRESVFELILNNLENMFGWVGQMRR